MSVAARVRRPRAPPFLDPPGYARHRPEATLLYQLVQQHYPAFRELRAEAGRPLPDYVQEEFEAYLKCGWLVEGFLRVRCEQCHAEKLVAFNCKKRGFCPSCGARRAAAGAGAAGSEGTAVADTVAVNRRLRLDDIPPRHQANGRRGAVPVWRRCRATDWIGGRMQAAGASLRPSGWTAGQFRGDSQAGRWVEFPICRRRSKEGMAQQSARRDRVSQCFPPCQPSTLIG